MRTKKLLMKTISEKYVIFDTNIIIKAYENTDAFLSLIIFLRECKCDSVNFDLIEFEFIRNAYTPKHIKLREEFFNKISIAKLPFGSSLIKDAVCISRIYFHQGIQKGQISFVDCCIAAYLKKYSENLFLITMNHKDFPIILFDRLYIFPLDGGNEVYSPAFYQFNSQKWEKLNSAFSKVSSN